MGTISSLMDRLRRAREDSRPPVEVSPFGFSVGSAVVVWQLVSEIRAFKSDLLTTDEVFLEFHIADQIIRVSEEQPGFGALEEAMRAAFPATATWRSAVLQPPFAQNPTLLFRRGGDQGKG